jgi:hypothetical protein
METLIFSHKDGFADFELTGDLKWSSDSWRKRNGYEEKWALGKTGDAVCYVEAFQRKREDGEAPRYFVEVCDINEWQMIFVCDAPSLMELRMRLAPLATAWMTEDLDELRDHARKSFRAWHGHHAHAVCEQCDPEAVQLQRQRKSERSP